MVTHCVKTLPDLDGTVMTQPRKEVINNPHNFKLLLITILHHFPNALHTAPQIPNQLRLPQLNAIHKRAVHQPDQDRVGSE